MLLKVPMPRPITIEVCVDSVESALAAVRGGADRLELCGNLGLGGGTTPSLGLFKAIQHAAPGIPIMVMIRPRTGDFLYSASEIHVMVQDVRIFKQNGASGVVFGALNNDGTVDLNTTRLLVDESLPLQICFHRAFDMTVDLHQALTTVASLTGITRILTSGHGRTVPESISTLQSILKLCREQNILPGSGINPNTIDQILDELLPYGLEEIHLSGGDWNEGGMLYRKEGMGMGVGGRGEWGIWTTSEETVKKVRTAVDRRVCP